MNSTAGWISHRRAFLTGYAFVVVALTLPIIDWHTSMDFDNAIRVWVVTRPLDTIVHNVREWELAPPLWHFLAHGLTRLSPLSPVVTVRLLNYGLFVSLIPLVYRIGQALDAPRAGLIAAVLVPWNQTLFDHVTTANHYLLFAALGAAYTWLLLRVTVGDGSRRTWVGYALVTAAYGFTHYFAIVHVAAAALTVAVVDGHHRGVFRALARGDLRSTRTRLVERLDGVSPARFAAAHLPLGVLSVLWLPVLLRQYRYQPQVQESIFPLTQLAFETLRQLYYYFPDRLFPPALLVLLMGGPLVAVLGRARYHRGIRLLLVMTAAAFGIGTFVFSSRDPEHLFFLSVLVPIVVGFGLSVLATHTVAAARRLRDERDRPAASLCVVGVLLLGLVAAPYAATAVDPNPPVRDTDLKGAQAFATEYVTEETAVLSVTQWGQLILHVYGAPFAARTYGVPYNITSRPNLIRPRTQAGVYTDASRIVYSPEQRPRDRRRLRRLVSGHDRVVVFVAHGFPDRVEPLVADLRRFGYRRATSMRTDENGVLVYDRDEPSGDAVDRDVRAASASNATTPASSSITLPRALAHPRQTPKFR